MQSLKKLLNLNPSETKINKISFGKGTIFIGVDLQALLKTQSIRRENMTDDGLTFIRKKLEGSYIYFIANLTSHPFEGWINLSVAAKSVAIFDPLHFESGLATYRINENNRIEVFVQIQPGESCILQTYPQKLKDVAPWRYYRTVGKPQTINGTWEVRFIEGGPILPKSFKTNCYGSWTDFGDEATKIFSGTAKYIIQFKKPEIPADEWLLDLGRVGESARKSAQRG